MNVVQNTVAFLTPGAIVLGCIALVQAAVVGLGCLLGRTLNYFHIFEFEEAAPD